LNIGINVIVNFTFLPTLPDTEWDVSWISQLLDRVCCKCRKTKKSGSGAFVRAREKISAYIKV